MLCSFARQSSLHQSRGPLRDNDLIVQGDVVTMRVRDESEPLRVPRVEPQVLLRQVNTAVITDIDHRKIHTRIPKGKMVWLSTRKASCHSQVRRPVSLFSDVVCWYSCSIDTPCQNRFYLSR